MLMLFVLPCKTWNVVKPWTWLARSPSGDQQSQDSFPYLIYDASLFTGGSQGTHSQESVQIVWKQGQRPALEA